MKRTLLALVAILAASSPAAAQYVKDFVEVGGARANKLRGYGLVTGLNGNGDSPKGETARVLRNMLQGLLPPDVMAQDINARNAALVVVEAELAPFQKKGTRLDVQVSVIGDAKSLYGGMLHLTELRGPLGRKDPVVYALASGRLIVQGDARRGNNTTAAVLSGAIVEKELEHHYVEDITLETEQPAGDGMRQLRREPRKAIRLLLKKPDLTTASQLVFQINATALTGPERHLDVARALDGGSILVRIPTVQEYREVAGTSPAVDYEQEPVRWLDVILNRPINFYTVESAVVIIDDTTKTVSWTGEVRLREGSVMVGTGAGGPSLFQTRDQDRLSDFMKSIEKAITEQQLVDVVKALYQAGLIKAEVRVP